MTWRTWSLSSTASRKRRATHPACEGASQESSSAGAHARALTRHATVQPEKIEAFFTLFALRCGQLEKVLGSRPFFGGDSALFADYTFFNHYDLATDVRPEAGTATLNAWAQRVRAIPAVAAELAARPAAGPTA